MTGQRWARVVVLLGVLLAWGWPVLTPGAVAQEYEGSPGSLAVVVSGSRLELSGGGFMPNSVVRVTLSRQDTGETVDLGTLSTDGVGALAASVSLPDDLEPGRFSVSATGMAADGSTRVLSSELEVTSGGAEVIGEPSGGLPAGAIVVIALGAAVLVAAGWWLFLVWRRRRARE